MTVQVSAKIVYITNGSIAEKSGLRVGDQLLSINSQPVRDMLDYRYLTADEEVNLLVLRDGKELSFKTIKDVEDDLGIEFEEELFDGVRKCQNNCIFCFLHQMPKGLRDTLYVRDDDYRLSLAQGNYITLTNLNESDIERICSQRMSPLYISVHATDTEVRKGMMRNKNAEHIMETLRRFADSRITMHTQIVLCPGWNDEDQLEKTVLELASLRPNVESIAIVPVGLTKYRDDLTPLCSVDADKAREIIEACESLQSEFLERFGTRLVFPSDEFYIRAGIDFPDEEAYEGYPQLEDGIGVSRLFIDELDGLDVSGVKPGKYVLITGTLAQKQIQLLVDALNTNPGVEARVLPVKNDFLGESITVAGLLAGCDVLKAISETSEEETILIPDVCLNDERFIDDVTMNDLKQIFGARVAAVPSSPMDMVECIQTDILFSE